MQFVVIFLQLLLLIGVGLSQTNTTGDEYDERRRLKRTLLRFYDRFQVPTKKSGRPVNVTITMWPYEILQVSEAKSNIRFSGWLDIRWIDPTFQWNPEDHMNITHLVIPASQLWLPSIDIYYSQEESTARDCKDCYVKVDSTGETLWGQYFSFSFPCTINVKYFPFDEQSCEMELVNWYLDDRMMDLYPRENDLALDLSVFLPNVEWELVSVKVTRNRKYFTYGWFPSIAYHLRIKRKPFYYLTNLVVPTLIITLTAVIGLHLPSSGAALHQEKVQMGITAVLSMFILQLGTADKLPRTTDVVPLIGVYYSCMVMILSLSIVSSGLIIYVERRGIHGKPVPACLQQIFLRRAEAKRHEKKSYATVDGDAAHQGQHLWTNARSYGAVAPTTLPASADWSTCFCNAAYRYSPASGGPTDEVWGKQPRAAPRQQKPVNKNGGQLVAVHCAHSFEKALTAIRSSLGAFERHLVEEERQEAIRRDWSDLADVVERISLTFFVSATLVCFVAFYLHDYWY